jgi:hypothetical protein
MGNFSLMCLMPYAVLDTSGWVKACTCCCLQQSSQSGLTVRKNLHSVSF